MEYFNSVVSGRSLLASPAKLLNPNIEHCTYLEYKTFCDFLEAVLLHEEVYIIGDFNEREKTALSFMQKLNSNGEFIFTVDDSKDIFFIGDNNIDVRIKEIVSHTFNDRISFIRKQLLQYIYTDRYNDDERIEFLTNVIEIINKPGSNILSEIQSLIINKFRSARDSEFTKHLLRAVNIAAYSSFINGSAKFTGSRKPLGILIIKKNSHFNFSTPAFTIYKLLNFLFIKNQKKIIEEEKLNYFQPLILSIFLHKLDKKENAIDTLLILRNEFKEFRNKCKIKFNTGGINLISDTKKYFNEVNRLSSNNNFLNLLKKYYREILLDDNINIDYEVSESESTQESSSTTSVPISRIVKNIIKFNIEFYKNKKIKKDSSPLVNYFTLLKKGELSTFDHKIVKVNEYYKNNMKTFDSFINEFNI
jgi:hypothetical protein